jgi:hypothetical protein
MRRLPVRRLPEAAALVALLVSLLLGAPVASAAPGQQDADEPALMGLSLATTNASGQWTGQWLGAHRYNRDGALYVVTIAEASWAQLQQALSTMAPAAVYVLGDTPYVGDGTCAPGALRHWWHNGELTADRRGMSWQPSAVPATAPAVACPSNLFPEAGLLLRLAGDAPAP